MEDRYTRDTVIYYETGRRTRAGRAYPNVSCFYTMYERCSVLFFSRGQIQKEEKNNYRKRRAVNTVVKRRESSVSDKLCVSIILHKSYETKTRINTWRLISLTKTTIAWYVTYTRVSPTATAAELYYILIVYYYHYHYYHYYYYYGIVRIRVRIT